MSGRKRQTWTWESAGVREEHYADLSQRQLEVAARTVSPALLAELMRERPKGACLVCWKDVHARSGLCEPKLICTRRLGGPNGTLWCWGLVRKVEKAAQRAQQRAKLSLLQEDAGRRP